MRVLAFGRRCWTCCRGPCRPVESLLMDERHPRNAVLEKASSDTIIHTTPRQGACGSHGCGLELVAEALNACGSSASQYFCSSSPSRNYTPLAMSLSNPRRRLLQSGERSFLSASICLNATNRSLKSLLPSPPTPLPPSRHMSSSPPAPNRHKRLPKESLQIPPETRNPRPFLPRVPEGKRSPRGQEGKRAHRASQIRRFSTRFHPRYSTRPAV